MNSKRAVPLRSEHVRNSDRDSCVDPVDGDVEGWGRVNSNQVPEGLDGVLMLVLYANDRRGNEIISG